MNSFEDFEQKKKEANELRKSGNFEKALPIYKDLWEENGDKFDGAGLLNCLRKLKFFNEALVVAGEYQKKYSDFDWGNMEMIWTLLQGRLNQLKKDEPLENVVEVAQNIMKLNPTKLSLKLVVFKVLTSAKDNDDWELVSKWVDLVEPSELSTEPMTDERGRKGWSDQARWYNFKITALVKNESENEAINLIDEAIAKFAFQKVFFLRLKAQAYHLMGSLDKSEEIYKELCSRPKVEWWITKEYSSVVKDLGKEKEALKLMSLSAVNCRNINYMVRLIESIGSQLMDMDRPEDARNNLLLCKYIRLNNNWNISEKLNANIQSLDKILTGKIIPENQEEALKLCNKIWEIESGDSKIGIKRKKDTRKIKKGLTGQIKFGHKDQSFCFIISDSDSFFCLKSDLPGRVSDGTSVNFDAMPSFDRKKNRESWRASNIHL